MNCPIDIIVPVYRGLQDVKDCLNSVLASQNKAPYELIVIDDCSPEPEVSAYLKQEAQKGLFTLLVNDVNLGFVATVNRGMQLHEDRDVLLLNSDTIVANDWLDRIQSAGYADERVGTVTPFSNNATICSYPEFCQDNTLPTNTPLAVLDGLFAQTNAGRAVDVPTGVGFCMYIRRACLREVGYFDVETFGKGYGEENDFCQRALQAGWENRFALDVFVQHTGNVSFGDEHNDLKHSALAKLTALHPSYERQVHEHIAADPAKSARAAVWLASLVAGTQPIVIHVTHNRGGGTLRFVKELSDEISGQAYSLMLMPSAKKPGHLCLTEVKISPDGLQPVESEHSLYFDATHQQKLLLSVLRKLPVSTFHFHHMLDLPDWVMPLPKQLGVDWFVSLHDFYFACPSISLTNEDDVFSGPPATQLDRSCCPKCASEHPPHSWRNRFQALLDGAKICFAPSADCARRMQTYFPDAPIQTVYHQQSKHFERKYDPAPLTPKPDGALKVIVIGALGKIKGADLLEATALLCKKRGLNIHFELLGYAYRDLSTSPKSNLTVTGRYNDKELTKTLREKHQNGDVDLVWFTSVWPETFSYTLSSAIEAKLPVLGPDIGAFPERVYGRPNSWVLPWDISAEGAATMLQELASDGFSSPQSDALISSVQPTLTSFTYQNDYTALLNKSPLASLSTKQINHWIEIASPLLDGKPTRKQIVKNKILSIMYRLRCSTLLRPIVQRIPARLQRAIKSRLST